MAARASWKGFLRVAEISCPVALYTAVSTSERIAFHTINRESGHRLRREFIDGETGKPVPREDQVKGYEVGKGDYVILESDEVASAVPESNKTLAVSDFIPCDAVDELYLDRPYYLGPADPHFAEPFLILHEGMRRQKVAAIAHSVLFRRVRTVLLRAHGDGFIANMLRFDWEVKSAKQAFEGVKPMKIEGEMLDLAEHIIKTKSGAFDAAKFDDRYEKAVADLVAAKLAGKPLPAPKRAVPTKVVDLMAALRQSAGMKRVGKTPARKAEKTAAAKTPDKPATRRRAATAKPAAARRRAS